MDPSVWGPPLWRKMHMKTFNYPENPTQTDKVNIIKYFNNIANVLPCDKCKRHYVRELMINPVSGHVHSRKAVIKWLIDFHNKVNRRLGKRVLTYKEVYAIYEQNNDNSALFVTTIFCTAILMLLGCKR